MKTTMFFILFFVDFVKMSMKNKNKNRHEFLFFKTFTTTMYWHMNYHFY